MAEKQISPERKAARDAALADDPELDRRMVVYRGVTYEVRAPSIKQVKDAEKHATHDGVKDDAEMTLRLIIESVFTPLGEKVFEAADLTTMLQRPSTATTRMMQAFAKPIGEMGEAAQKVEELEKNSDSAPT